VAGLVDRGLRELDGPECGAQRFHHRTNRPGGRGDDEFKPKSHRVGGQLSRRRGAAVRRRNLDIFDNAIRGARFSRVNLRRELPQSRDRIVAFPEQRSTAAENTVKAARPAASSRHDSSSLGNSSSETSNWSAAATGIAMSAPTTPSSAPPIITATTVTPPGTLTARPMIFGVKR
jgi:hypothetical protein